jgi:hypothetical protein
MAKTNNAPDLDPAYFKQYEAAYFWVTSDKLVFLPENEKAARAHGKAIGSDLFKIKRPKSK